MDENLKPLAWIGSSYNELLDFPQAVRRTVGFALYRAQLGQKHESTKPLKGFGGASVLEIIANDEGDTFRTVYTVRFANVMYVLHCFQKKSKSGIATIRQDIELIKTRLKQAEKEYERWKLEQSK